jgi:tetratricopeptide (TPR) repeat protein
MTTRRMYAGCLILFILCGLAFLGYQVPYIHDRVAWRFSVLEGELRNWISPPPETIATPDISAMQSAQATLTAMAVPPSPTRTPEPLASPLPTVTPLQTFERAPVPVRARLVFPVHEWQVFNNCGPASLSMLLQFWGWAGDQLTVGNALRPNSDDKNVMPEELEQFASAQPGMDSLLRTGGTLDDLRGLIAADFPVIVEMGFTVEEHNLGWMGHYALLGGYNDDTREFFAQDSYRGPDYAYSYADLEYNWRAFNFTYLAVFPTARRAEVEAVLGPNADAAYNRNQTLALASRETATLRGESLAFAFFNLGTNLVGRQEYTQAAAAFDQARFLGLPYRFLWYQIGPYPAYFHAGRYQDVVNLAGDTLKVQDRLEEAWYWRGRARFALGDTEGAVQDLRTALVVHPGYDPALQELARIGVNP